MSINISLNSFMNGGNTRIIDTNNIKVININTIKSDKGLGILINLLIWLVKLQITFDNTKEQIINKKNSLKLHTIKKLIQIIANLKKKVRFKLFWPN